MASRHPIPDDRHPPTNVFERIINALDSEAWETLKEAGWEKGDFLPLYSFNPPAAWSDGFTSTTWTSYYKLTSWQFVWNDLNFPTDYTPKVMGQIHLATVGADETVDIRLQNIVDGETIFSETGLTSGQMVTGYVTYEPTTKAARTEFKFEYKESPGVNSSTVNGPILALGVEV